ncbi:DUF566 domain containing protein [Colletotrichum scovillei]|uniref:DUF566 domain containing protein n=1 Tax=Colletotrichum scovillei TaxID=1209932 RepID=A0A9P7QZC1_9PEZI|nr:DUF566 domain containing protein [Colletotrichum scovillei]KAG7052186.1 DUF566 domain containing protein [Colletotrichum scovillei]KAG7064475.1 DUF566 domain containing protein [Colletotrichum scovillei]
MGRGRRASPPKLPPRSLSLTPDSNVPSTSKASNPHKTIKRCSDTMFELWCCSRKRAFRAWLLLVLGNSSSSGSSYGPAKRTLNGCILCQKRPTKAGYVETRPVFPGVRKKEAKRQYGHRLAIVAFHRRATRDRLLQGLDVSHLCGQTNCINPGHLVVESNADNHARKRCRAALTFTIIGDKARRKSWKGWKGWEGWQTREGRKGWRGWKGWERKGKEASDVKPKFQAVPTFACTHEPRCVKFVEEEYMY